MCNRTQTVIMHAEAMISLPQSISLPKLAGLLEMDGATLRAQLMLLKSTALVKTWNGSGDGTEVRVASGPIPTATNAAVVSWGQPCTICESEAGAVTCAGAEHTSPTRIAFTGPLQGDFLPAADVDFYIDMDPTSGEEMVTVEEAKQIRRQGASSLLFVMSAMRVPLLSGCTLELQCCLLF